MGGGTAGQLGPRGPDPSGRHPRSPMATALLLTGRLNKVISLQKAKTTPSCGVQVHYIHCQNAFVALFAICNDARAHRVTISGPGAMNIPRLTKARTPRSRPIGLTCTSLFVGIVRAIFTAITHLQRPLYYLQVLQIFRICQTASFKEY